MSDPRDASVTPEESLAREALRALPRPVANQAFRARLKREFLSGVGPASARRAPARAIPGWRARWVWALAPAAAAAALVVGWLNQGPAWTVVSSSGPGVAVVDGRPITLDHREDLERALRRGAAIRVEGGRLELVASGQMAIELTPATSGVIPPASGRWFGRRVAAEVHAGEMRITTGRGFRGARLTVSTPEAAVEVTGTTLAVIRESAGTCVCVMDGKVMMGPRDAGMAPIPAGMRRFVFNDGRPPEEDRMRPVERIALAEMRTRHADRME